MVPCSGHKVVISLGGVCLSASHRRSQVSACLRSYNHFSASVFGACALLRAVVAGDGVMSCVPEALFAIEIGRKIPRDKWNCTVRFGNGLLRCTEWLVLLEAPQKLQVFVATHYKPSCLVPCCQGKLGEFTKNQLTKHIVQSILSLSIS